MQTMMLSRVNDEKQDFMKDEGKMKDPVKVEDPLMISLT